MSIREHRAPLTERWYTHAHKTSVMHLVTASVVEPELESKESLRLTAGRWTQN